MRIEAVLLDLDGTLLDHEAAVVKALHNWLPTIADSLDELDLVPGFRRQSLEFERLSRRWFVLEEEHFSVRSGETASAGQRRRRLRVFLTEAGIKVPDDKLDGMFADFDTAYQRAWTAYPDAIPTCKALVKRGITIAVLTNGARAHQAAKIDAVGLGALVGQVFASEGTGIAKPELAAYSLACERLGVAPEQTLMCGDNYELDVRAPRAAGLSAVHLDRLGTHRLADVMRISTLTDLPKFV